MRSAECNGEFVFAMSVKHVTLFRKLLIVQPAALHALTIGVGSKELINSCYDVSKTSHTPGGCDAISVLRRVWTYCIPRKQNPPNGCHPLAPAKKMLVIIVVQLFTRWRRTWLVRVMTFERIGLSACCRGSWQGRYWIQNYIQSQWMSCNAIKI